MQELEKVDYTIPGTKIPTLPSGTRFSCSDWRYSDTQGTVGAPKKGLVSFGTTTKEGKSYIQVEIESYDGANYYLVTLSDLEKISQPRQEQQMRKISYNDAQKIVDIACSTWKTILFNRWGRNIVLKQEIEIDEQDYQQMREACTSEQNRLFDSIFGAEHSFKVGDWVIAKEGGYKARQVVSISNTHVKFTESDIYTFGYCRLATQDEISIATGFSDGTPCLVRDSSGSEWKLRYSNGKGEFYTDCRKSGNTLDWKYVMKLDMHNLPVGI